MSPELVDRHPLKEKRRANKPLLERKRRAKINDSLRDLKFLVLSNLNKDVSKFTKMEKVDILDMTVQFLKGQRLDQRKDDCAAIYRAGFSECTNEVIRLVMGMDGIDHTAKTKILSHLTQTCQNIDKTPPTSPLSSSPSMVPISTSRSPIPSPCGSPERPTVLNSRPILETSRQIILPIHSHPQAVYPLQVKPDHKDIRRAPISAFCRPCHQQPPLASIKPMLKPVYVPSLSPDLSKEFSLKDSKRQDSVWRPW